MLNKDTHQRYERQLAHKIKFIVTLYYVIFRCVTKVPGMIWAIFGPHLKIHQLLFFQD